MTDIVKKRRDHKRPTGLWIKAHAPRVVLREQRNTQTVVVPIMGIPAGPGVDGAKKGNTAQALKDACAADIKYQWVVEKARDIPSRVPLLHRSWVGYSH
jgi:hypothetical protein